MSREDIQRQLMILSQKPVVLFRAMRLRHLLLRLEALDKSHAPCAKCEAGV